MDAHDVLILGTGVPEAVLSAALSRAGKRVIHVDAHDYYGSDWASLTLKELLAWAQSHGAHVAFPRHGELTDALARLDRHYSLSVRPALLPAHGPMIEALVRSNVAAYATFRLLDRTGVYDRATHRVERVPSSKSEIFRHKNISLADKRRLMRFLQLAISTDANESTLSSHQTESLATMLASLQLDARLTKAVQYGVCLAWDENERADTALARTHQALAGLGRYGDAAYLVGQYGGAGELAQGFCRASAVNGATFVLGHEIKSLEHNGEQWLLRLDGIDEVFSATQLVCAPEAYAAATSDTTSSPPPSLYSHMAIVVVDAPIDWERMGDVPSTPETALLVLPPGSVEGAEHAVMVLMQGEGTFSCPKGQYVYYLLTYAQDDKASPLHHAIEVLMTLLHSPPSDTDEQTAPETPSDVPSESSVLASAPKSVPASEALSSSPTPLLTLMYTCPIPDRDPTGAPQTFVDITKAPGPTQTSLFSEPRGPFQAVPNLTETLDLAVEQAEETFWKLYTPENREAALSVAAARRQFHDPAEYQGRGGAEPDITKAPPRTDVEFFAPREDDEGS
ncbi:hypothetical protein MBRA1_001004 [Malassezia brasiliensis]|uniref:Rab proteins geranylgeranyltransferase component A n=1 Tax=Malassezia brasiliensis TaxID=1821822 RepID=A0AAF0DUY6_9BASI|nr:hypothetical protein MBRA1_001004 [Malassezia brasiliensis]